MKTFQITLLATWLVLCSAIEGAFDDIPTQCNSVCSSLAEASNVCETLVGSDDTDIYAACVCDGPGAMEAIRLCEACVHAVKLQLRPDQGYREWSMNDANRLLRRCNIPLLRDYDLSNPSSTILVTADTSAVPASVVAATTGTGNSASHTITNAGPGPSSSTNVGSASPATSESASSHVPNLAVMPTLGAQGMSFVAGIGLLMAAAIL